MVRCMTAASMLSRQFTGVAFTGAYEDAFGHPQASGFWMVYGKSGSGKSTFSLQLAKELDDLGLKVMYMTVEEGASESFKHAMNTVGITETSRIAFTPGMSCNEMMTYLRSRRAPQVIVVDSIQFFTEEYKEKVDAWMLLKKRFPKKLFIFISHVDGKEVEGKLAYVIKRDCALRIQVERFRAIHRGRGGGGKTGYMDVWAEKAAKLWME